MYTRLPRWEKDESYGRTGLSIADLLLVLEPRDRGSRRYGENARLCPDASIRDNIEAAKWAPIQFAPAEHWHQSAVPISGAANEVKPAPGDPILLTG